MRKFSPLAVLVTVILLSTCTVKQVGTGASDPIKIALNLINPALPGDNPDPSIIRVKNTYYATSTTNEWAPSFKIYKSTDLKEWTLINHVFPEGPKDMKNQWGISKFWASELSYDPVQDRIYVYYTAQSKTLSGNPGLHCGIAWIDTDKIETGKFTDNGPVIVEKDCGAIDAFEMIDNGKIYAFWKNDGNGCGKETWIWMQEINATRTQLIGEKKKLFTASQPWENLLVEGACFFKKGEYYYSLYAVGGCCDAKCNYKTGIARTKSLASGAWEKYDKNPIMESNENWRCPGHGTVVETPDGRLFMLYHGFNKKYDVFVGREGIVEELIIGEDGWPVLHNATLANRPIKELDVVDDFKKTRTLNLSWQWPSKREKPIHSFNNGLMLGASTENHEMGTFLGQYIKTINFSVETEITPTEAGAGIALGGAILKSKWPGELGAIGITASARGLTVFNNLNNKYEVIKHVEERITGNIKLEMKIYDDFKRIAFSYHDKGKWINFYHTDFEASKYTPWGMGYRVGIIARGTTNESGKFNYFKIKNNN